MADKKISELTALTGANVADTDLLPIVDISETETKKITFGEFKTALDTATGFVRITGDTMTGALDVQSTITADGLTVDGLISTTASQSTDGQIRISNSTTRASGNKYGIRFADSSFETNASIYTEQGGSANNAAALIFGTNGGTGGIVLTSATERMRIDSGGNVGIGTSNATPSNGEGLCLGSGSTITRLDMRNTTTGDATGDGTSLQLNGNNFTIENREAGYVAVSTSLTERMRIDSSGNVGIGTVPTANNISKSISLVNGGSIFGYGNGTYITANSNYNGAWNTVATGPDSRMLLDGNVIFSRSASASAGTAGAVTESMRIDSSGNTMVGLTAASARFTVGGASATAPNSTLCRIGNDAYGSDVVLSVAPGVVNFDAPGVVGGRMMIDSSGNFAIPSSYDHTTASGANVFFRSDGYLQRSTSSLKYKNTVEDAPHGLTELLTLRPVTYKGNNDGDTVFGGLIAEEVHDAGLTEFVQYNDDGEPDALAYGNMVSLCIKAIQEQQAIITALETRLSALEG
jgi:hypothetical protein